jgi:hypothetical protein
MPERENMKDLTDEEYDRLDEKWTKTTPKVGPNGSGFPRNARLPPHTVMDFTPLGRHH